MSELAKLFQGAKVDPKIVSYIVQTLQLESLSDFIDFWGDAEYEAGIQSDVVQRVPGFEDLSRPKSKIQVARLRAAWKTAQDQVSSTPTAPTEGSATPLQLQRGVWATPIMAKVPVEAVAAPEVVGTGWAAPENAASTMDGLWAALEYKAQNPLEFMDVSDVVMANPPGFMARSISANTNRHTNTAPETRCELDSEPVIAVQEDPLRIEFSFSHRHMSGYRMYWQAPVDSMKEMVQELGGYAAKRDMPGNLVLLGMAHDAA